MFALLFTAVWVALTIMGKLEFNWALCTIYVINITGIIICIVCMFTGMSAYKFSISHTGITMYESRHTYKFSWDDFVDYGISVLGVSSLDAQSTFWIYFAKRCLRDVEKCDFLRKIGRKRDYIAYFQYSAKTYDEVKQYFPAEWREQLDWELAPWIENMTLTEKIRNR